MAGRFYYLGNWFDKTINAVVNKGTVNAGSELYFRIKGSTTATINFTIDTTLATPYFSYSIDGGAFIRQIITNGLITLSDTNAHNVRINIDAISQNEDMWISQNGIAISGITTTGTLQAIKPRNRVLLIHGDSIGEGVRVLGGQSTDATAESDSKSFPFYCCQNLNAVSYRNSWAGTNVVGGGLPLYNRIDHMTAGVLMPYSDIDMAIVEIGTNDESTSSEDFKAEYSRDLLALSIKYSGLPIICLIPLAQTHAQDIRDCVASASKGTYAIETSTWVITFSDGLHPDIPGAKVFGNNLSDEILAIMGKSYFM